MKVLPAFVLLVFTTAVSAQPADEVPVPDRFGVKYQGKSYPQKTAKEALASAIDAAARGKTEYLVAHLLDPAFVDARVADRSRLYESAAEADLIRLRDAQRRSPEGVPDSQRIPGDPATFRVLVARAAADRAAAQLTADVKARVSDDPEAMKELRRFLRDGMFADGDPVTKVTLPDVKDRAVFLKKVGDRWFIENRQVDEKAPAP